MVNDLVIVPGFFGILFFLALLKFIWEAKNEAEEERMFMFKVGEDEYTSIYIIETDGDEEDE